MKRKRLISQRVGLKGPWRLFIGYYCNICNVTDNIISVQKRTEKGLWYSKCIFSCGNITSCVYERSCVCAQVCLSVNEYSISVLMWLYVLLSACMCVYQLNRSKVTKYSCKLKYFSMQITEILNYR